MNTSPPLNIAQLNRRVSDIAEELGVPDSRIRKVLCVIVVSQMLPNTLAVKGGMGIKLRFGELGTRATSDLDVSSRLRGKQLEDQLVEQLQRGWGTIPASKRIRSTKPNAPDRIAFTATLKRKLLHNPGFGNPQYLIHPYQLTIYFLGRQWAGLDLEISDSETSQIDYTKLPIDAELKELASRFGFGELTPVPVINLEHQIAQKIHATTDPNYWRPHDLVDLQLLISAKPDMHSLRQECIRTFKLRKSHNWPPIPLRDMSDWAPGYNQARAETLVDGKSYILPSLPQAQEWLHKLITAIEQSK